MTNAHKAPSIYEVINLRDEVTGTPKILRSAMSLVNQEFSTLLMNQVRLTTKVRFTVQI